MQPVINLEIHYLRRVSDDFKSATKDVKAPHEYNHSTACIITISLSLKPKLSSNP